MRGRLTLGLALVLATTAVPARAEDATDSAAAKGSGAPATSASVARTVVPASSGGVGAVLGWSLVAVGTTAIIFGGAFGIRAFDKWDDVEAKCSPAACADRTALDDASSARTSATVANATLAAGAVLLVSGLYVLLTTAPHPRPVGPGSRSSAPAPRVAAAGVSWAW